MSNDEDKNVNDFANQVYVFKTNVPLRFAEELKNWNDTCRNKAPDGFEDYRWGKMMYDHYFVKNYKPLLETMISEIKELRDAIEFLSKRLDAKKLDDANKDLFK